MHTQHLAAQLNVMNNSKFSQKKKYFMHTILEK